MDRGTRDTQIQIARADVALEGGSVGVGDQHVQSFFNAQLPIDEDQEHCYFTNSTRGAASMLDGKKLTFIWDEQ